jgi:hypothetical protein
MPEVVVTNSTGVFYVPTEPLPWTGPFLVCPTTMAAFIKAYRFSAAC